MKISEEETEMVILKFIAYSVCTGILISIILKILAELKII